MGIIRQDIPLGDMQGIDQYEDLQQNIADSLLEVTNLLKVKQHHSMQLMEPMSVKELRYIKDWLYWKKIEKKNISKYIFTI